MGVKHDIEVRPIEPGDLDALLELCREHAAYEKAEFRENGQVERWRAALFSEPPALHGWMALDGGRPCGFMTVTTDFATWSAERFAYMDCLYLQEPYRGRGIGRMFLDRLREFSVAQGCGWAEWQTPTDNELGIGFYRRMGAGAKTKIRFHYAVGGRDVS
ncbi:GNAT family N-acetyltransferase [Streptomyces sudanensis]|uniref:GNAT family N-acetyltransferase n=1 Tax=Streptomyces sudanensis TaxID=436397 RepID=UPI0020CCDAC0|nr:GNAT family N-acetyltransferase [Streptomyces sudanensis]MCP9986105.1 GNAT family N-acetyltransferase [Streptomyces sudanensis]